MTCSVLISNVYTRECINANSAYVHYTYLCIYIYTYAIYAIAEPADSSGKYYLRYTASTKYTDTTDVHVYVFVCVSGILARIQTHNKILITVQSIDERRFPPVPPSVSPRAHFRIAPPFPDNYCVINQIRSPLFYIFFLYYYFLFFF